MSFWGRRYDSGRPEQLLHSPGQDDVHGIVLHEGLVIEIGMRATGVAAQTVIVGRAHDV